MRVAIVIPAFNLGPLLGDCLRSLLDQTHANWSAVVVDDGSTDTTGLVARDFSDRRIALVGQQNAGVSAARNAGMACALHRDTSVTSADNVVPIGSDDRCTYDAFLFLDGDDWLAPDALKVLAETLAAAPNAIAACGRYARVASDGAICPASPPAEGWLLEPILTRNLFANGGHVLIRRQAIEAAGGFCTDLSYGEDWEYWSRVALLGEFVAVRSSAPLLFVRERPGSAYLCHGTDPDAYQPAMDAIYRNPQIVSRFGRRRLTELRRRAEAETAWSVGRELIRHGRRSAGQQWLRRSIRAAPDLKRLLLIVLSGFSFGPFRRYQNAV